MPYNVDFDKLSIELGISTDKLIKNIKAYESMSEIFPALEAAGCKVGLFGGTALNKIYFAEKQRLSYDLDIIAYSYEKCVGILKRNGATIKYSGRFPTKLRSTKMEYKGTLLDIVSNKHAYEEPAKLQAFDLLYYHGNLIPPVVVPSYSLEYLLAEKTLAMLDRNELRDIYDTWIGIKLLKDTRKYKKYIKEIASARYADEISRYKDRQIQIMLLNIDYYKKKQIEVSGAPEIQIMLMDVKAFLDINI